MSIDINLVSKKTSESASDSRLKKVRTLSFASLFIVASLSLVLFLVNFRFSANYVKNQQNKAIEELSSEGDIVARILVLGQRTDDIGSILSQRRKSHEKVDEILRELDGSMSVDEYQIDDSGINLQISSASLLQLNDLINQLLDLSKTKKIGSVTLVSLSSDSIKYILIVKIN